jgi:DNA-binding IclR family transcriptional regulator
MSGSIRAVERALDVLLCFTYQTPELTMTQIAEQVGINKSTIHRVLATLEKKRFVERDPVTGIYRLGIRLLQMASLTVEGNDLRRLASPLLHRLCKLQRENVNLAILDESDVVYLEVVESPQRVKLAATSGQRLPAFCTASGKTILAFMPEEMVKRIVEHGMPRYTPHTLSPDDFFEDIRLTQERGYAISEEEYEEGINAIAAPIFDRQKHPIASVSVAGPAYRLSRERMVEIAPLVINLANDIAQEVELAANLG